MTTRSSQTQWPCFVASRRTSVPVPTYDRYCRLVDETFRRWGGDPRMGMKLYATFVAAGLPGPFIQLESVIGSPCTNTP